MVAMTVTPLMARVFFLLIMGKSFLDSDADSAVIKSALDGTASKWYFAETLIFILLTSSPVGFGIERSVVMISRRAVWLVKEMYQK
jgi:hypothetical protein